ncbi:MAG: hypothetical protein MRZ79_27580 [Bacteroidia bacterium]|nr:hypothetical protein [Bacteroidia bacterium]
MKYKYIKQLHGRSRYGEVELEIKAIEGNSKIIDACSWATLKESYPNFAENDALRLWKASALQALNSILEKHIHEQSVEITLKDVSGTYADTLPAHIGAAVYIGIFDLLARPLSQKELEQIDKFAGIYRPPGTIPDFRSMLERP